MPVFDASLRNPLINQGTHYAGERRDALGITGKLPPATQSLEQQAQRVIGNLRDKSSALEKYCYLSAIQDENETLYFRVILDHLEETLPVIYTPTVGEACQQWSRIFERCRGLYLSAFLHRGRIRQLLEQWNGEPPGIIVVTDGGRILGLGDLGVNGMGIPIGKLALYTACAGVDPARCLPICLDVGTDNQSLLSDPGYLGTAHTRIVGDDYDSFLDEFIQAVATVFPDTIVQFEDFNNANAFRLLARYRDSLCCFNDDIQGTGAMGLAGLYAAGRLTGEALSKQKLLFVGTGEAGLGIGKLVLSAMQKEGLSESEARSQCLFMDSQGLVVNDRALPVQKQTVAQDMPPLTDLVEAIEAFSPTVLIGTCGQGHRFDDRVLNALAMTCEHPTVFALSNPTSKAECTAEEAYRLTEGRALYASGSPFSPVLLNGHEYVPGQGNNAFVFPGVGLGLMISGARRVSDGMFVAAAHALDSCVTDNDLSKGRLFPAANRMREVAVKVAAAVAQVAYAESLASLPETDALEERASGSMYQPVYSD